MCHLRHFDKPMEEQPRRTILDTPLFRRILYFKLCMVVFVWGLPLLLLPASAFAFLGIDLAVYNISLIRLWGLVVILNTFYYTYILRHPRAPLSKFLIIIAVCDNGGLGIFLLLKLLFTGLPWGVAISIPFQLFFGYWFYRFMKGE